MAYVCLLVACEFTPGYLVHPAALLAGTLGSFGTSGSRYLWADRFDIALPSHKKVQLTNHYSDEYNFDGLPHGNEQTLCVFSEDEGFSHIRRAHVVSNY